MRANRIPVRHRLTKHVGLTGKKKRSHLKRLLTVEPMESRLLLAVLPSFEAVAPAGSLIYQARSSDSISAAAEIDEFTFDADADQSLTIIADVDLGLELNIELRNPASVLIDTITGTAGEDVIMQAAELDFAGTYTINVSGANSSLGDYALTFQLNALSETETEVPTNDTSTTAESLDSGLLDLVAGTASRFAITGELRDAGGLQLGVEDFESGTLGGQWSTSTSHANGRIRVSDSNGAASGSQALLMDVVQSASYSLNEAVWSVDLSTAISPTLDFSYAEWGDEENQLPASFVGSFNGDGVSISEDGINWHTILNASNSVSGVWEQASFDLAAEASAAGIALDANFRIKFQQYDNFPIPTDGRGYDAIRITDAVEVIDWYRFPLQAGKSTTLAVTRLSGTGNARIDLYAPDGTTLIARGVAASNVDQVINGFKAPTSDEYFARVSGADSRYSVVVTQGSEFDTESNSGIADAQPLRGVGVVFGHVGHVAAAGPAAAAAAPAADNASVDPPQPQPATGEPPVDGQPPGSPQNPASQRIIVQFADGMSDDDVAVFASQHNATISQRLRHVFNGAVLEVAEPEESFAIAQSWGSLPGVNLAETEQIGNYDTTVPNDPRFGSMWALNNTGQTGGTVDADIDAPEAWDLVTDSSDVVIAILDSGVNYNHPDLQGSMWVNVGEIPGNSIDDDGNGFVDDVHGINASTGSGNPIDTYGHGTHVAGTTAAIGNNATGVVGVNWNAQIMALGIGSTGPSTAAAIVALDYLIDQKLNHGVNVVSTNNSYSVGASAAFETAIQSSIDAGVVFVAAAGNSTLDIDTNPRYPASYPLDGIIAVAATDHNDARAGFSNYGATSVDIGAPGVAILSTMLTSGSLSNPTGYGSISGTSMASPHVAGAAALLAAANPSASVEDIKAALLDGSDPVASMSGVTVSGGRLNLFGALEQIESLDDYYRFHATVGDIVTLTTSTPLDGLNEPSNSLDPFVELYSPSATLVDMDDNGGGDGRNAFLAFTAAETGDYVVRVAATSGGGEYVLHIDGNTDVEEPPYVVQISPVDGAVLASFPDAVELMFSEPMTISSVAAADVLVGGMSATSVQAVDNQTFLFSVPSAADGGDGTYDVTLLPAAVEDLQGIVNDGFTSSFTVDRVAPRIVSTQWNGADLPTTGELQSRTATIEVFLSEPILMADSTDVTLQNLATTTFYALDSVSLSPGGDRISIETPVLPSADYQLTLISGDVSIEDLAGNDLDGEPLGPATDLTPSGDGSAGGNYSIQFTITDEFDVIIDDFGNLLVTDYGGASSRSIDTDGVNVFIHDADGTLLTDIPSASGNGTNTVSVPLSSFPAGIHVNAGIDDDSVTIDLSMANFGRPIIVDGQDGTDSLFVAASNVFTDATYDFNGPSSGNIGIADNSLFSFGNVELVASLVESTDAFVNYSEAADAIVIRQLGATQIRLTSTAASMLTIGAIPQTLSINAGEVGSNSIQILDLPVDYPANLDIVAVAGSDAVSVDAPIALDHADVSISADTISFNAQVETNGGDLTLSATDGIAINAAVLTDSGEFVASADSDSDGNGDFFLAPAVSQGFLESQGETAADAAAGDFMGQSVAISGNTAIIGAPGDDNPGFAGTAGAAYIYQRIAGVWSETQKLIPVDRGNSDWFGISVAIDGDTAVVGAHRNDNGAAETGAAYVYVRSAGSWALQQKLAASDLGVSDWFGESVSISGDTIVVGSYKDDDGGTDSGSAYVFQRTGVTWTEQQKLVASDASAGKSFGGEVAISGDTIVVTAVGDHTAATFAGAAYVYSRTGVTWTEQQKLYVSNPTAYDRLGTSVSIDGETILVGADGYNGPVADSGAAVVYVRNNDVWTEQQILVAGDAGENDSLGRSVSLRGDTAIAGAIFDDDGGSNSGAIYAFSRVGTTWNQQPKITASDTTADLFLGTSVAVDGDVLVAGTQTSDAVATNAGKSYFFTQQSGTMTGSISAGNGNVSITAAAVEIAGAISGTASLRLTPSRPESDLGIGAATGQFSLDDSELANLQDGFATISIGDEINASGIVTIDSANFTDPATIYGGIIHDSVGMDIRSPRITLDGVVSPGQSIGLLQIDGDAVLASGGEFHIEIDGIAGPGVASGNDQLIATGNVDILPSVSLHFFGTPDLSGSNELTILGRSSGTGTFAGMPEGFPILDLLGSGRDFWLTYQGGSGSDIQLVAFSDFGDAPAPYPTLRGDGGAEHADSPSPMNAPMLGANRDVESDGQPTAAADGDGADDDGVVFGKIRAGDAVAGINIDLQNAANARVDAWIDFDRNGVWDASEQILDSIPVIGGWQTLNYVVPVNADVGTTYARVRVSSDGDLSPTGLAADGEVEDYEVTIEELIPEVDSITVNDGAATRSALTTVSVTFDTLVNHLPLQSAFVVTNTTTSTVVGSVDVVASDANGKTTARLQFSGASTLAPTAPGLLNTLDDGNYRLDILAVQVVAASGGRAMASDDVFGGQTADEPSNDDFFRWYGDSNGDGSTNFIDFSNGFLPAFATSIGEANYASDLDANGDGSVNFTDFANGFLAKFASRRP